VDLDTKEVKVLFLRGPTGAGVQLILYCRSLAGYVGILARLVSFNNPGRVRFHPRGVCSMTAVKPSWASSLIQALPEQKTECALKQLRAGSTTTDGTRSSWLLVSRSCCYR